MDVLSFLVGWFVLAIFTAAIAVSKSRSAIGWFILSAFFPILALIAVGLMPSLKEDMQITLGYMNYLILFPK